MGGGANQRKKEYFGRLKSMFDEYPAVLLVEADFVGSHHMQLVRKELRGMGATMLMGKNTMIRKAMREHMEANPQLEVLLPHIKGNRGFVFCSSEKLSEVKSVISGNRVPASAKAGVIAPISVSIPAGNTGLEPTQTSFLQALNIASKITKGQIEIIKDVNLITQGEKVGASEAALLSKLNIKPFTYGLEPQVVYDQGSVYEASLLDLTDDDMMAKFQSGLRDIAAISLALHIPTQAGLPHVVVNGYKDLLAIAVATEYSFAQAEQVKAYLANPSAFAAASGGGGGGGGAKKEEAAPEPEEEEEEEEEDLGFGLFD